MQNYVSTPAASFAAATTQATAVALYTVTQNVEKFARLSNYMDQDMVICLGPSSSQGVELILLKAGTSLTLDLGANNVAWQQWPQATGLVVSAFAPGSVPTVNALVADCIMP